MILLQDKVDYSLSDDGRVFARELNLVGDSLKSIITATGDTRPGDDNAEAVVGAIDDLARLQVFKMSGKNLVRYGQVSGLSSDPLELKEGQMISIYVTTANFLPDNISVSGVPFSVEISGQPFSNLTKPDETVLTAIVDKANSTIDVINVGAKTVFNGSIVDANKLEGLDSSKFAKLNGDSSEVFQVAEGVEKNDAASLSQVIPIGGIIMWSGALADIPASWRLCDGQDGTPDLTGRMIYGADESKSIGETGGSEDAVVVAHYHNASHDHPTAVTNTTGSHTHKYNYIGNNDVTDLVGANIPDSEKLYDQDTGSAGDHSHTVDIPTRNFNTAYAGVSGAGKNLPPYFVLAFIIKVS